MNQALDLYRGYCKYPITDNIQLLDYKIDIKTVRDEMFTFIANNHYGFNAVSLRLPPGESNYIQADESLESTALPAYEYLTSSKSRADNPKLNSEYTEWHPDLKDSYVAKLVPELEKFCGFNIGRVRLGWLMPNSGYPIHQDLEPLRLHIPLLTNSNSYFIHEHKLYHMDYGHLYHLITTGIHTAWNFGQLPRLHLIFSTYGDAEIEESLSQLSNADTLHANFSEHVSGIDRASLAYLYKIFNQSSQDKERLLHELKAIDKLIP